MTKKAKLSKNLLLDAACDDCFYCVGKGCFHDKRITSARPLPGICSYFYNEASARASLKRAVAISNSFAKNK